MSWSRRKVLTISTIVTALIGVILLFVPFVLSLSPTERADAALSRIDVSNIAPGTYKLVALENPFETHNEFKESIFFLRTRNGNLQAWFMLAKKGEVGMPDFHWWNSYFACKAFGPDMKDGFIDENSLIQCHDNGLYPGQASIWRWRLNGEAVSKNAVDDMYPARGVIEGDYFVLGKIR